MNVEIPIKELQNNILSKFKNLKWDDPKKKNACDFISKKTKSDKLTLNNTQKFVSQYLKPSNPNGILLWHSVGSGKTLTAVATLKEFEKQGYNTLWITRTTLKKDLQKALDMLPLDKKLFTLSYKQFSNIAKRKGANYKFLIERAHTLNKNTDDPLYKTIVVIDEAHKLYTKDLKPQEMHDINAIQKMIFNSYDSSKPCKIILMSATPITSDPLEIIKLFNLIIEDDVNRFDLKDFKKSYLNEKGEFTDIGKEVFQDRIKDLVSYIDMSKDPSKFAQVEYNEILVPISSPEFDIGFLENPNICEDEYKYCRKILELPVLTCKKQLKECKSTISKNKKFYKTAKYQSKLMYERCGIKIINE